jgi:hypothetical protein
MYLKASDFSWSRNIIYSGNQNIVNSICSTDSISDFECVADREYNLFTIDSIQWNFFLLLLLKQKHNNNKICILLEPFSIVSSIKFFCEWALSDHWQNRMKIVCYQIELKLYFTDISRVFGKFMDRGRCEVLLLFKNKNLI